MKRRTYPGTIYADYGKLIVKFKGQKVHTGLTDNKLGRQRAEEMLIRMYESYYRLGENTPQPVLIEEAFKDFLEFKMNRYPATITSYKAAYKKIISGNYFLAEDRIEKDIRNYLRTTDNSNITKNIYLRDLQIFLNYCSKKKWLPVRDFKNDYKVKTDTVENIPYTLDELVKILRYFAKVNRQIYLMCFFMSSTGARLVDCLTLEWEQIRTDEIIWQNKITKKPEIVPLSKKAIMILKQIKKLNKTGKVFTWTYNGTSFLHKQLRIAFDILGIKGKRSFQEFRVTFRMSLIEKGIPAPMEMRLMRHHDYKVTDRNYTKIEKDMLKNYLEK